MTQTTFTMRIEEDAKDEFSDICDIFGISMASAISLFINTVIRERRIPFEISATPHRDPDTEDILRMLADMRSKLDGEGKDGSE